MPSTTIKIREVNHHDQKYYFLSHIKIVKDVTKENFRRNLINPIRAGGGGHI